MPTRVMNNGGVEAGGFIMEKGGVFKDVENNEENGLVKNWINQNISSLSDESSSSIGKNSDLSENLMEKSSSSFDGEEVQSSYNKGPLDAMEALEEVLPIRRGISSFYNGKSKSFTILSEASSSSTSIKAIAKPDNAYARKRRNQLSCSLRWDKARTSCLKISSGGGGGISKRPRTTTLALGLAMGISESGKKDGELKSSDFSPWRSFSLADLQQHCVSVSAAKTCSNSTLNSNS
ncbi:hypothetical protein PHJA_002536600 [Phtheirospermum japonicum]|uniref:Uncharacterized protein n=1 Tax=Phtheirospermum japonicum TaxID=374723 RepID=A0A830CTM7_9LAMI|nr:hypothetical protein PHJA_002536600 [Phtheirospermum japonicum]